MTPTIRETIERLRELEAKATPGPWYWNERKVSDDGYVYIPQGSYLGDTLVCLGDSYEGYQADLDLLSELRNHCKTLLTIAEAGEVLYTLLREAGELTRRHVAEGHPNYPLLGYSVNELHARIPAALSAFNAATGKEGE